MKTIKTNLEKDELLNYIDMKQPLSNVGHEIYERCIIVLSDCKIECELSTSQIEFLKKNNKKC